MIIEVLIAFLSMFVIIDVIGNSSILFFMLKDVKDKAKTRYIRNVMILASIILVLFLLFGDSVLKFFGVSLRSFQIAGAIIVFIVGIEMVLGIKLGHKEKFEESNSIVPMATPLLIGPGVLTVIILLVQQYGMLVTFIASLLNMIVVWAAMNYSGKIYSFLGKQGSIVITRIMGLIIVSIGIEIFLKSL
jgi:multiple antibiotic resistance protein